MKIHLNNIGIITETDIDINDITVLTGFNNSGKTTVEKALHSVFSAVTDIENHGLKDKYNYVYKNVHSIMESVFSYPVAQGSRSLNVGNSIAVSVKNWMDISPQISMNDQIVFNIEVKANEKKGDKDFYNSINNLEIKKVIFIETADVLDDIANGGLFNQARSDYMPSAEATDYYQLIKAEDRKKQLADYLFSSSLVYQEIAEEEKTADIFDEISSAFDDEIKNSGDKLVCGKNKLDVRNLAAGSKLFALLRQLMLKGQLDNKTLLILDEPDNHLHPEWQILLARTLNLINQRLGVKILLTTHCTNLIYALDVDCLRLNDSKKTLKVYNSVLQDDDYSVHYEDVTDDMDVVYKKLGKPFLSIRRKDVKRENNRIS